MSNQANANNIIFNITQDAINNNVAHLLTEDTHISGSEITIQKQKIISFSSCSYLGLEQHEKLKEGAKTAIDHFGTQFSSSRAYLSLGLYHELEEKLSQVFQNKVIVTASTTLGHLAAIPALVEENAAVLIDHQVHHSVQLGINILKGSNSNIHFEVLRHNDMDALESKIKLLRVKYKYIWYMADGIYSMYGDFSRIKQLEFLLNKYEYFNLYIDDAHGMSYFGKNGRGYVLSEINHHPRMVLATSLNKAFASGGGCLIFNNDKWYKRVRYCGSTLITSGPLQPANLGAGIASADIHLSPEIYALQQQLHERIELTRELIDKTNLPLIKQCNSAIFFIGLSLPKLGYALVKKLLQNGFYTNLGIFPAVPIKNTGLRFTITNMHSHKQIYDMVNCLSDEFTSLLQNENYPIERIYRNFNIPVERQKNNFAFANTLINKAVSLNAVMHSSILDINKNEWNSLFEGKGIFDWNGMALLESIFSQNEAIENNWQFNYIIIRGHNQEIVVATCVTTAYTKDDMLMQADISIEAEASRKQDPYFLTSLITATGTPISEGRHIFINKENKDWKNAVGLLLEKIQEIQESTQSSGIMLRDFYDEDKELFALITNNGYFKLRLPDSHVQQYTDWQNNDHFYPLLNRKKKDHFNSYIKKYQHLFEYQKVNSCTTDELNHWYQLYGNVKNKNLEINTFTLPFKFFCAMANNTQWEIFTLRLKEEDNKTIAVVFNYKSGASYMPVIIGMDYTYLASHHIYKQALYRMIMRGRELNCTNIQLGFSASTPKRNMNCKAVNTFAFVQVNDHFNSDFLQNLKPSNRLVVKNS